MSPAKKVERRKPETKQLNAKEAEQLVKKYAVMTDRTIPEARCALIASGWRRLSALARYAESIAANPAPKKPAKKTAPAAAPAQKAAKTTPAPTPKAKTKKPAKKAKKAAEPLMEEDASGVVTPGGISVPLIAGGTPANSEGAS